MSITAARKRAPSDRVTPAGVVKAFVSAVNKRDWDRVRHLLAADVVRHSDAGGRPVARSQPALVRFLQRECRTFPDAHEHLVLLFSQGGLVGVVSQFTGTQVGALGPFQPSGRQLTGQSIAVYRVAKGIIREIWCEWDNLAGLRALGHVVAPPNPALQRTRYAGR